MGENYKLPYDIREKYSRELSNINERLINMENGRIYKYNNNNCQNDGSLQFHCSELRKEIAKLLLKIQNGSDSIEDSIFK